MRRAIRPGPPIASRPGGGVWPRRQPRYSASYFVSLCPGPCVIGAVREQGEAPLREFARPPSPSPRKFDDKKSVGILGSVHHRRSLYDGIATTSPMAAPRSLSSWASNCAARLARLVCEHHSYERSHNEILMNGARCAAASPKATRHVPEQCPRSPCSHHIGLPSMGARSLPVPLNITDNPQEDICVRGVALSEARPTSRNAKPAFPPPQ